MNGRNWSVSDDGKRWEIFYDFAVMEDGKWRDSFTSKTMVRKIPASDLASAVWNTVRLGRRRGKVASVSIAPIVAILLITEGATNLTDQLRHPDTIELAEEIWVKVTLPQMPRRPISVCIDRLTMHSIVAKDKHDHILAQF